MLRMLLVAVVMLVLSVSPARAEKIKLEGSQFVRQWRLLRAVEGAKRGMTVAQLKEAIEETQSTRTLHRDLEVLQKAGFPLTNADGPWRLLETSDGAWAIPVSPTEVVALMLTEDLMAAAEGSWLAQPLTELRTRLSSSLTPTGSRYCAELRKANIATLFGGGHYGEKRAELEAIHEAIEVCRLGGFLVGALG